MKMPFGRHKGERLEDLRAANEGRAICPHCGGSDLREVRCTSGPHHARLVCRDCGRHVRFLPAPWTLERARTFVLPYGKHRGHSIGDLAGSVTGRGYLQWLATRHGNAATAAGVVLGLIPGEGDIR
jgi:uncharacterized protein (DUF3820 family)